MRPSILFLIACIIFTGCKKNNNSEINSNLAANSSFIKYIIPADQHYCEGNIYKPIETVEMKFTVRFDSSAIYQAVDPANQYDINKLYGFADNNSDHHQYSARFGWRWSDGALRLFAYVYNEGSVDSKELGTVAIGEEIHCSIRVFSSAYLFSMNDTSYQMPRMAATEKAKGYQLYPYFGGDESAPHEVRIWVREDASY